MRQVLAGGMIFLLTGCSTLSSINWSAVAPWNWFSSGLKITEQGVGKLSAYTPLEENAIKETLGRHYRLCRGMKTEKGNMVQYFEALRDNKLALVIEGDSGKVSRIDVLDASISTDKNAKVGTPFTSLYDKAYGNCNNDNMVGSEQHVVRCRAADIQHISYLFSGEWKGPEGLIPPDNVLRRWNIERIIWQR